jgi:hypothetical protein
MLAFERRRLVLHPQLLLPVEGRIAEKDGANVNAGGRSASRFPPGLRWCQMAATGDIAT